MQHISNKSRDALYDTVSQQVMDARIKIEKLNIEDEFIKKQIESILYNLNNSAPQAAISCFKYNKER